MRWVAVSVRGMLRGCDAVNRARRRAGLLRRTDSGGVQSERARKHVSMHKKGGFKQPFFMGPSRGVWAGSAAPGGDETMPVGTQTRRVTANLPAVLAADVEQLAQDAGLTTSAWVARILAPAVRSLKPRGNQ